MISFLDRNCAELSASTFFSHTQRAQNGKFIQMQKKQHDLAHSSSEEHAKLNFTVLLKVKAQSQANAIRENGKGNGCNRREMRRTWQSSNGIMFDSHC